MAQGYQKVRRFWLDRWDARREVDEEIRFHLDEATRELAATGLPPAEARREAERRFGDVEHWRAGCYQLRRRRDRVERRGEWRRDWLQDLKLAGRSLLRQPASTATAVLTLALGLGGAIAVFSLVWGILLRPLPLPSPDRLMALWEKNPERGWMYNPAAPANFLDWRSRSQSFQDLTAVGFSGVDVALAGTGEPEMLRGWSVYPSFFSVLGVQPVLGRGFHEAEAWQGRAEVVVISHELWQGRFGGDPGVVGRSLDLGGRPRQVVGVAPPGLAVPEPGIDLWMPFGWEEENRAAVFFRRAHFVWPIGRLRPGIEVGAARTELATLAAQLEKEYPETNKMMGAGLTPYREWLTRGSRTPLWVLLAATGTLLLIACANLAHLQLSRALPRLGEMRLRAALGASRRRLLRLLLTESLVLAGLAGLLGLLLAAWSLPLLLALAPEGLPRAGEVGIDPVVAAFGLALTLATGLLFGLVPALSASGRPASQGRRATAGTLAGRVRNLLLTTETALAVMALAFAGLLARSLFELARVDPGFRPEGLVAAEISLPGSRYPTEADALAFFDRLEERARALPGVEAVAFADALPLGGDSWTSDFAVEGRGKEDYGIEVHHRTVSPGYFRTVGVPLLAGRTFGATDGPTAERVVVVNDAFVRRHFAGEDPLGRRLCFDRYPTPTSRWRRVVGVVGGERVESLHGEIPPEIFEVTTQDPANAFHLLARTGLEPGLFFRGLKGVLRELDPGLPLAGTTTLTELRGRALGRERFLAWLLATFAGLSLLLAVVGVYGVVSYGVRQRTREIGIRMAIGARAETVVRWLLGQALLPAAAGLALGLTAVAVGSRWLRSLLFEVAPGDPATLGGAALLLALAAAAAAYLPARRAAAIDPALTLREE